MSKGEVGRGERKGSAGPDRTVSRLVVGEPGKRLRSVILAESSPFVPRAARQVDIGNHCAF